MAEGKDTLEKSVEDLEKEITCAICHDHYAEPRVLPCCHYYCKKCIRSLALRTGIDKPFSCPECRKDTTLPQGNVDNFPTAFFVNRMKEMHSKLERAHGKVDAKCEMCSGAKAEAFCRQCTMFICAECVNQHRKMKVFAGHKTATLDELREGGIKEIVIQPSLQTCKLHEELMKFYCFDCSCLICRDCTVEDHLGHSYKSLKKAVPETKKKLIQHLNPLKEMKVNLSHAVKEIQTTKSELEAQGHSVANHIECSFDELHKIIEHHKQTLLTEAATKVTQKLKHLSGQEKSLSTACAVVQSVIEYTEQCVQHSADDEVMCMHAEIQSRIILEIEEQHKEEKNLAPVEEVDIGVEVSCIEDLKHLCRTKAKITQLSSETAVTGKGMKSAEVNEVADFLVTNKLSNGQLIKQTHIIECLLKSLVNGSIIKCQVKGHEHRIKYTPTVRGRHELTVTVNGQEVAGSPFPVFVSIHPTKLGKPVRVIPQLALPGGVAINSVGEIIVAEWDGDVVTLNREGKRLRSIKQTDHNLKHPLGVAVDEEDNIYFVDESLSKCDKQMKKIVKSEHTQPLCVAVIRDEVMVCDSYKKNTITVYSKELEHVRTITLNSKLGTISNISSDELGNLYACAVSNLRIHVFSNNGDSLHSFGCDGNGENTLKSPRGVCVSGQYVYVANWDGHNISVFTTEGEYVTSFGQEGRNEGDFYSPWGVCVDKDGFVYVCDYLNYRIQLF